MRLSWFVELAALVGLAGCEKGAPDGSLPKAFDGGALTPRQEVVAQADRLAAAAERQTGADAILSLTRAAQLRERVWRLEGRSADGLEAAELLAESGKRGDCIAGISSQVLRAEVSNQPGEAARAIGSHVESERDPDCRRVMTKLLGILGNKLEDTRGGEANARVGGSSTPGEPAKAELLVPALSDQAQRQGSRVLSVHRYGAEDSARIVVALSHPATYHAGVLRSGDGGAGARLYVDIDRARVDKPEVYEVGGLVQRVRLGQHDDAARLVLDLKESVEQNIFYMPEPFRLIIDVAKATMARKIANRSPRVIERLVIDPGHGGHDPGAVGPRGLREKDVTLDIAHRAAPLIARELGLSTLLTRDTDAFVPLDERTARANAFRADLFISIHCNAAERTGSDGVMTFVLDTSSDAAASRMAALENAASDAAAKEFAANFGRAQDEGLLTRSLHFAGLLQRATVASLGPLYGPIQNQGVRRAGFYVLAGAHMPAVLFEVAFISNPDGEVRLNTADYRQKLADSLVNAIRAYRDGL